MDIAAWLARARADADARGLPDLKPLLETLARSTQALRDADPQFGHPAADRAEHEPRNTAADYAEHAEDDKASE
jgi:hypothetical protein